MSGKLFALSLVGAMLFVGTALAAESGAAISTFTPRQEAVLLSASRMIAASERCDAFSINDRKLTAMLTDVGISEKDVHRKQRSPSLQANVQSYAASFKGNRDQACSAALSEGRQNGVLEPSRAAR